MAFKDLTTPTILTILDTWLDPNRSLPSLKTLSRAAPLIPDLVAVRKGLQDSHAASAKSAPEIQRFQATAGELDVRHDRKARGLDKIIDGLSELVDDPELTEKLGALRTEILGPKGLLVISSSYTDEAQNAKLVDKRLSPESKELLGDIKIYDKTLGGWVKDWQGVAKELGEVESERTALETKTKAATASQPAPATRARNRAIRTLNALMMVIELDEPTDELRTELLGPLEVELAKAEKRAKRSASKAGGEPVDPETPSNT
jgi:hypothetical protein